MGVPPHGTGTGGSIFGADGKFTGNDERGIAAIEY